MKWMVMVMVGIFMMSFASAFEFDNVKTYNEEGKVVTVINSFGFGDVIGQAKLNTPLNVKVGPGYQKVAEFEIWSYDDYEDTVKKFTFMDMKEGDSIDRDFDLKKLSYEKIEVDDYKIECHMDYSNSTDGINLCKRVINGTHLEIKETWTKIDLTDLKKNEMLTIGIFTDVQHGDYVDWSPVIFGERVDHNIWASWTEDLNADLFFYYKLDDNLGTTNVLDSYNGSNDAISASDTETISSTTSKINRSFNFTENDFTTGPDFINLPDTSIPAGNSTTSVWIRTPSSWPAGNSYIWGSSGGGQNRYQIYTSATGALTMRLGADSSTAITGSTLGINQWYHIVVVWDWNANNARLYLNSVSDIYDSTVNDGAPQGSTLVLGAFSAGTGNFWQGYLDEVSIWHTLLNTTQISNLYNSGDAITYSEEEPPVDNNPDVTLVSPTDASTQSSPLNFTYLPTDDFGFLKSELYVNVSSITSFGSGELMPMDSLKHMDTLRKIVYKDAGDSDNVPDLFFSYIGSLAEEGCIHYYGSNVSNPVGFNEGTTLLCVNILSTQRGVTDIDLYDINNDGVQDLVLGTETDYVSILYGNVSVEPPFNEAINISTPTGNEADYNAVGFSSSQTFMDIFNVGEEVCSAGTCLYHFVANASVSSGYNPYIELGGIPGGPDTRDMMTQGYINDDDLIDTIGGFSDEAIWVWYSNETDSDNYNEPIQITSVSTGLSRFSLLSTDEFNQTDKREINGDGIPDIVFFEQDSANGLAHVYALYSNDSESDYFNDKLLLDSLVLGTAGQFSRFGNTFFDDWNKDGVLDFYATSLNEVTDTPRLWVWYGNESEADYFDDATEISIDLINKTVGSVLSDVDADGTNEIIGIRHFTSIQSENPAFLYPDDGTWGVVAENSSTIINNSNNNILYDLDAGTYLWNILVTDNNSQSSFATGNYTFTILEDPEITIELNNPSDSYTSQIPLINFSCDASYEDGVTELNLVLDGVINETVTNSSEAQNLSITKQINLPEGNYTWSCNATNLEITTVSANRNLEVLYPDSNITLLSPDNDSDILTSAVLFVLNTSDVNGVENVSLFINGILNDTNYSGLDGNYSFYKILIDGDYNWSVSSTSVLGKVSSSETRFFSIHTLGPSINIDAPSGRSSYFKLGDNETLIYDISKAGENLTEYLVSCWYVYPFDSTPSFINCTGNTTEFIYEYGYNNITVFAEDEYGFISNTTSDWDYDVLFTSQTYSPSVHETSLESFSAILSYDSSSWSSSSAEFVYDNIHYDGLISGSGNLIQINGSITIPIVSVDVNKTFYWVLSLTNATGTYDFQTDSTNQTVTKISFEVCDYSSNPQLFFETFSTTAPTEKLNATFSSAWTINDVSGGDVVLTRSFEDVTETNSSWGFCIYPNSTNYTVSAAITVEAVGFTPTSHYIVDADYGTSGQNISLYLLNDSDSTLTEIRTVDQDNVDVADVYLTIQRYDLGTDTYYNVGMANTDSSGSDLAYLKWYDTWYRFIGVKDGEVVFTEGPEKISASPRVFKFGETAGSDYEKFKNIEYSLTFVNTTNNFVLSFVDPSGEVTSSCLRVIKRNQTADFLICRTCAISNSATLYCNIATAGNGTFIADYYATGSPISWIDSLVEIVNAQNELFDMIGNDNGTGMAIVAAGIVLSMFLITPALGILGAILGMVLAVSLGFQPIEYMSFMGIIVVGVAMMWAVQK